MESARHPRALGLTLTAAAYTLRQTMVVPTLPALQRDLHTSTTWVTWLLTVFFLSSCAATPLLGKLGDRYGKRRLLIVATSLFFAGAAGAAVAAPGRLTSPDHVGYNAARPPQA